MAGKILIAYTSRRGSTAEIAEAMGKELEAVGNSVQVTDMKNVASIEGFQAVVIGTPIYLGKVEKPVHAFVARHREGLLAVPVAAFAVGITPVNSPPEAVEGVLATFRAALDPVKPVAVTMFAGVLDMSKMSFLERTIIGSMKILTGDFRDWDAIKKWARELPAVLKI
ncbi:MAG TPA: flavodoxin domain-containing protein [Methanomicrobiales archaeon]|nr:flavodoxin domain-containing protein [Methanomicrobiales archaeon]